MKSVEVNISDIRENPNNPRLIKDDKFKKLVQSIKDFPQMLAIRPIVVNADMTVLGGNMRLKACKEAGLEKVPVIMANYLTEEQQKEFIIKDNVGFGEWDWEMIANEWDSQQVTDWGMDIPDFGQVGDIVELPSITTSYNINIKCDSPLQVDELRERLGITSNNIHVVELYKLLA